jgi:hypothetical protein
MPVLVFSQDADPYPPSQVPDRIILTWSGDPATTQSVSWRTDISVKEAWAEIAPASADPYFKFTVDTIMATASTLSSNRNVAKYHSVTFTNLHPDTKYAYRVGNGTHYSEWFHFKTAKSRKAPFSFIYFGDAQNDVKSMWSRCIREAILTMPDADFLLHAGDLINIPREDKEWGEWFYAGGWINGMKSNILTPGNHEYYRSGTDRILTPHWQPSFTLPENGPEGLEETVYYIDYQGVRIISLNTQSMLADPESLIAQKKWLEKVLQENKQRWTIITQHHPIYSTAAGRDNRAIRQNFQPLYEEYQVDLVLQGHDHTYGRGHNIEFGRKHKHRGPMYVVSVSGPKMYNLNFEDWLERVASNTQLYQLIHINGKQLKYEAYTATGVLYDAFELTKRRKGTNRFKNLTPLSVPEEIEISRSRINYMSTEEIERYLKRFRAYKARKEKK